MICKSHLPKLGDKCPTCFKKRVLETQDCWGALSQILWECPGCNESFTESNMRFHLLVCGTAFACEFSGHGCMVTGNYKQVQQHESGCSYRPENCPNEHCAELVIHRDLASHVVACDYTQTQIPGTTVSGPASQINPVNAAIAIFDSSQPGDQASWEVARRGFFNLLSLLCTRQVTTATDSSGSCQPYGSQACQASSVTSPLPCHLCNQPVQAESGHVCKPKKCGNCFRTLTYPEINFHQRYCHQNFRFAGRTLLFSERSRYRSRYITYTGDFTSSCYVFLPEDTFSDEEIPIRFEVNFANNQLKIKLSGHSISIQSTAELTDRSGQVEYMFKFYNSQGQSLSSALHINSATTLYFTKHPEIAALMMRQAQILVFYIGFID